MEITRKKTFILLLRLLFSLPPIHGLLLYYLDTLLPLTTFQPMIVGEPLEALGSGLGIFITREKSGLLLSNTWKKSEKGL